MMNKSLNISIKGVQFQLLMERAIFWAQKKTLILADLHLGKTAHFRKAGIPLPQQMIDKELQQLITLIHEINPKRVLFLGDLFHSDLNNSWFDFTSWMRKEAKRKFILVKGNHDIVHPNQYILTNLTVQDHIQEGDFGFIHDPDHIGQKGLYYFAGHIHPGVKIRTGGRQSVILPCFHVSDTKTILPAFGLFTGCVPQIAGKNERFYAVSRKGIINVNVAQLSAKN